MSDSSSFPLPGENEGGSIPPDMHANSSEGSNEMTNDVANAGAGSGAGDGAHENAIENSNAAAGNEAGADVPENAEVNAEIYSEDFPKEQEAVEIGLDAEAPMSLADAAAEAARALSEAEVEETRSAGVSPASLCAEDENQNRQLEACQTDAQLCASNDESQNRRRDAGATETGEESQNLPAGCRRSETGAEGSAVTSANSSTEPKSGYPPERRRRRRAMISAQVRIRTEGVTQGGPDEISTTVDVSRIGFLFLTSNPAYKRDMEVLVTFPYSKSPNAIQAEQPGRVARVTDAGDGRRAVAIAIGTAKQEIVDSGGRALVTTETVREIMHEPVRASLSEPLRELSAPDKKPKKHLVLAVDASQLIRDSLKAYLTNEGYDVIAVETAADARQVLDMFTPSIVIAEIEGEGLPGYDLCAHVKTTPRLARIPVVLTTSSAYPSDYSSAHSLGAVVCMAKPFKQERLGHVVRLLAPPPQSSNAAPPPRAADPSRRAGAHRSKTSRPGARGNTRGFRILPN